jgi:hypothetical protein
MDPNNFNLLLKQFQITVKPFWNNFGWTENWLYWTSDPAPRILVKTNVKLYLITIT